MADAWTPLTASLQISREVAPYARLGLNEETAERIAGIVYRIAEPQAVAITDTERILAYVGQGCPWMRPGLPVQTDATRRALRSGEISVVRDKQELECPVAGCPCPIRAAVIAPLKVQGAVVGTVKLYPRELGQVPAFAMRLAVGISELVSLHLELAEAERQRELLAQARLEALQAQIRPHFLFNTLNTIIATSRKDPGAARNLLVELAAFLRHSFTYHGDRVRLVDEIDFVDLYLKLQKARYGDRLKFVVRVDPAALSAVLPVLTLQPLVENAVVHGLVPKEGPGRLVVGARRRGDTLRIVVLDDGVGIAPEVLPRLLERGYGSGMGLGLSNVHERLVSLFGPAAGLRVMSRPGRGTLVTARIPWTVAETGQEAQHAQGTHR
ncbi:MAG: histidine kinase [Actinomycetia bacterium]|nr:histidine kinase [Actinomycetes bacterium]